MNARVEKGIRWFKFVMWAVLAVAGARALFAFGHSDPGNRLAQAALWVVGGAILFGGPAFLLGWLTGEKDVPESTSNLSAREAAFLATTRNNSIGARTAAQSEVAIPGPRPGLDVVPTDNIQDTPSSVMKAAGNPLVRKAFAAAMEEVKTKTYEPGLWAMSVVECNGDERAAGLAYVKARAAEIVAADAQSPELAQIAARQQGEGTAVLTAAGSDGKASADDVPAREAESVSPDGTLGGGIYRSQAAIQQSFASSNKGVNPNHTGLPALTQADYYKAAIGPKNQKFYLDYFARADAAGRMLASWNWPAFFFVLWWFHRKMFGWGITLVLLGAIISNFLKAIEQVLDRSPDSAPLWFLYLLLLALYVVPAAILANGLYYQKVKKLIEDVCSTASQPEERIRLLERRGGILWARNASESDKLIARQQEAALTRRRNAESTRANAKAAESAQVATRQQAAALNQRRAAQYREAIRNEPRTESERLATLSNLFLAVRLNRLDDVTWPAATYPESIDATDSDGRTPLHIAVEERNLPIVTALLDLGADPRVKNNDGASVLDIATRKGTPAIVAELQSCLQGRESCPIGFRVPAQTAPGRISLRATANSGAKNSANDAPARWESDARKNRMAAAEGDAVAQNNLGSMYFNGQGVPQDYVEAARWYRKAADQGLAQAQRNLGLMYFNGQGVPQDYVRAHKWLSFAASGFSGAEVEQRNGAVKMCEVAATKMTPDQLAKAQRLAREWKRTQ